MRSGTDGILAGSESLRAGQEAPCKDLHQHPELSHHEHRTARCVGGELGKYGFTVQTGIGGTGVVGVLTNGAGPTVLLRAKPDALPVRENTGVDYASTVTMAADGHEVPVAHACGHDMHMSCLLGMAKLMADHRDRWHGTLLPLFQPGEETGDGAQGMVDGLLKRIPAPDVALAQHLLPGIAGTVGTCSGPFMSAEDSIKVTVYGRGSHGALPQNGIDPVVLAAMIIVRLQTVVSREVTPGEVAIVTVGSVQAGTRSNVIPDHAVLPEVSWPEPSALAAWTRSSACGTAARAARKARWRGNSRRSRPGSHAGRRGAAAADGRHARSGAAPRRSPRGARVRTATAGSRAGNRPRPRCHPRIPENPATLRVASVRSMPDWKTRIWVARCRPRHGPVMQTRASASDVPDATRPPDPRS